LARGKARWVTGRSIGSSRAQGLPPPLGRCGPREVGAPGRGQAGSGMRGLRERGAPGGRRVRQGRPGAGMPSLLDRCRPVGQVALKRKGLAGIGMCRPEWGRARRQGP
jgi:hypothetical protein